MDTLTHGLFGVSIAALRPRENARGPLTPTDKAVLLACLIAAEIPDLDYLLPAADPVLVTLRAHRGLSHSLVMAPAVAAIATAIAKLAFRPARVRPVALQALLAVVFGHLLPDLWTGWGTRILLPWSAERLTLDWTMVVDPLVTLPMLVAAVFAFRARRVDFRKPLWIGLGVTALYLGLRIGIRESLRSKVEAAYGTADVHVFPSPLRVFEWRYVVRFESENVAGVVGVGSPPVEQARHPRPRELPEDLRDEKIPSEVFAWARFPTLDSVTHEGGARTVTVGDLRYHAGGTPTLKFIVDVDAEGHVTQARMDRGGSASELFKRFAK